MKFSTQSAFASFFCLETKEVKIQDKSNAFAAQHLEMGKNYGFLLSISFVKATDLPAITPKFNR